MKNRKSFTTTFFPLNALKNKLNEMLTKRLVLSLILSCLIVSCIFITTAQVHAQTNAESSVFITIEPVSDSWSARASMQQARGGLGVAAVNGKIYAIGGSTASGFAPNIPGSAVYGNINLGGFVGTNEEYDPATNTWTYKASMPTSRILFATAVYQNKIYCIGGRSVSGDVTGGYTAVNEVYDPSTDTWVTKEPMPIATGWLIANVVDNKIYVLDFAGRNYVYDPIEDSWTLKEPAPAAAFNGYASAVVDKKIYVIGGLSDNQNSNLNQIYDTETDTWSSGALPPSSHSGGAAGATTGQMAPKRVYILGEVANLRQGEEPSFVRVYDPEDNGWTFGVDTSTRRFNFGVAALNDTFYVIGGLTYEFPGNFGPTATNEQYIPVEYGTLPLPSSSLEPSLSPSVSQPQTPSPTFYSPSPTMQSTQSPEPNSPVLIGIVYIIAAAIAVVVIIAAIAVVLKRR